MKRSSLGIIAILAAVVALTAFVSLDGEKELGRTKKIQGKLVFVMCEPVAEYETVETVNTAASSLLAGQQSITDQVKEMVGKAVQKEAKGKIGKFDAIITEDGSTAILIKFKE
jgi:hypothetical protein